MRLEVHLPVAAVIAAGTYLLSKSAEMSISCFLAGILIDLDHVFDYFVCEGIKFNIKDFFDKCYRTELKKYYLFLHSYEFILIVAVILYLTKSKIFLGVFIGITTHFLLDVFRSPKYFFIYSFFYRLNCNFDSDRTFKLLDRKNCSASSELP